MPCVDVHLGEKLRERLQRLEALAASTQSRVAETPAAVSTSSPNVIATRCSIDKNRDQLIEPTVQPCHVSDVSIASSSVATPEADLPSHSDVTPSELSDWDSTTHFDPTLLIREKHDDENCSEWTTTINCGCSSAHVQVGSPSPAHFERGQIRIINMGRRPETPNPYVNNLRIETICILAAMQSLGMYIGITEEVACNEDSSPFFRASAASSDYVSRANTISSVQKLFKTLKPNLRPNIEQITVQHAACIDILPFPTLRKNLIMNQANFDEEQFFEDLLTGLKCWGGAGIGKRDRDASTGSVSTGTPWDVRSWEANLWFLKKYWDFLGGEEGELVQQSEWWRSIRGEDDLV
ncbi:hypothetical protein M7I_3617 [Glarea lozoyensis 74030]|uniref:Uncharacterized protein n=1 Tax=Glarea lozoyensis (strain ATCC 74030 / MF5533) TaxID=1104152 RepID=H0ELZ2_GLAL7|nr:hypothetical protein M7I_3617 [Glarea lozoyensis 74030]